MNTELKFLTKLLGTPKECSFIPEDLDWQSLTEIAENHCLFPLFFHEIQKCAPQIPPEVFSSLQAKAKDFSVHNLVFNAQLIKLSKIFEANNIEFLAYKGATLAQLAYGDSALRQFGDLDILIRKKDFHKVKKIIVESGGKYERNLTDKQEKAALKYYYELSFLFGENQIPIEVHWAFVQPFFAFEFDVNEVFERSQKISIHDKEISTLSNEDLLIFLCVHGSKHFWTRLSWVCDIAKLIQNQPINWDAVIRRAKDSGSLRMLKLGVFLARDIFLVDLPKGFDDEKSEQINLLLEKIENQLFENIFLNGSQLTNLHLQMRERVRDKIKYSRRLFTTKLIDSLFMPMGKPQ